MAKGPRPDDDSAVSNVIAFMVAGFVFIGAIGAILYATGTAGTDGSSIDAASQDAGAQSLADLLVGSAGLGWAAGPDGVDRFGLLLDDGSGLDPDKLDALRGAMEATNPNNGKVDYEEARASLGLTKGDFHIRIYPTGIDTTYDQADLSQVRTAYIGDWLNLASVTVVASAQANALDTVQARLDAQMSAFPQKERAALAGLGLDFNDQIYMEVGAPRVVTPGLGQPDFLTSHGLQVVEGDVYPDSRLYLEQVLADRLPDYDLLVVGTEADQTALRDADIQLAVRNFVLNGGTLIVMGNDGRTADWLSLLFQAGVTTVNGAVFAPDVTHPVLHEPNALSWISYDTDGKAWDIASGSTGADFDDFTHVVLQGTEDVLAISNARVFGEGRIILTSFRPAEIVSDFSLSEATNFLENLVLYADHEGLYLDYGATLPKGSTVSAASRESHIWDETLGEVPVRVEVHYWTR